MASFEKFAKEQFSTLVKQLEDYMQKREAENLHKIRVSIKKIKATLLFVNDQVKGFKAHKNFLPFRKIFRRAGEIREPEVLSGLLLAQNVPGVHDQILEGNEEKLIENFCEDVPSFVYTVNKQWTKLKSLFRKMDNKDLEKYLRKTKKKIKSKLYPNPDMDLIHRVRKLIKGYIYLSEADHQEGNKKMMKFYNSEVDAIGDLHDRQVLLSLITKQNGVADKTLVKKVRQECKDKKKEIRKAALGFYGS